MSRAFWVSLTAIITLSPPVAAQQLAFGSETWRGHAIQLDGGGVGCRTFSHFGNGDRLSFVAWVQKESGNVAFALYLAPASLDTGKPDAPMSVGAVLGRMARVGQTPAPPRAWVDDSQDDAVQGSVKDRVVSLPIGMLDAPRAARFFNAVRDGRVLRITLAGEERRYALKGSFAALSELVGCAFKARDREITPSSGLPAIPAAPPVAAAPPPPAPAAPNPVMAAMPAAPAVPAPRRPTSSGSGVIVTQDGHVLTNQHVVEGCRSVGVRTIGGAEQPGDLLAQDVQNDLALLRVAAGYPDAATIRLDSPRMAETVLVYGFPMTGMLASSGNVSALTGLRDDSRAIQITAAVQPGNSGGPVFDASGLVIGIVRSKLDAIRAAAVTGDIAQNVNFAIRSALAVSFLGANRVEPAFDRRRAAMPADAVSEQAQKVTVQIICYGGGK